MGEVVPLICKRVCAWCGETKRMGPDNLVIVIQPKEGPKLVPVCDDCSEELDTWDD